MSYVLFASYFVLICWLLTKIKFVTSCGLSNKIIIGLFFIRIVTAIINGWMSLHYYSETDIIFLHTDGVVQYHLLINDPHQYFYNILHGNQYHNYGRLFDTNDSYWNNLRSDILTWLLSIFNIFSGCNYYIDALFYNFFVFLGSIALYKVFADLFTGKKIILIISLFLLPSVIFFTSVVHRDGLILTGLGIVCYNMHLLLQKRQLQFYRTLYILLGLLLIFLLRNFVVVTLVPALLAWVIASLKSKFSLAWFIGIYAFFIACFFIAPFISSSLNFPQFVSNRQIEFIKLSKVSASTININPLYPNFRSFVNNTPQAFNHILMRPYVTEISKWLYIPPVVEILIYELIFILFLLFPLRNKKISPFILFGIFFSLSMFYEIGLTIPIIGAFIRYRSIYFPFIIIPILAYTDWHKVKTFFKLNF